jgi:hypothetical protein
MKWRLRSTVHHALAVQRRRAAVEHCVTIGGRRRLTGDVSALPALDCERARLDLERAVAASHGRWSRHLDDPRVFGRIVGGEP